MREIVYVDMDGVLCDFQSAFDAAFIPGKVEYPQSQARFFENLKPIPGAIDAMHELNKHYAVWILTRASVMNPYSYTEKRIWVEEHLGMEFCDRLIMCPNKSLLKGDYLIDDSTTDNQKEFDGYFIHFGGQYFPGWAEVMNFFDPPWTWFSNSEDERRIP